MEQLEIFEKLNPIKPINHKIAKSNVQPIGINNHKKKRDKAKCEISKWYVPILVVDFNDHSHFTGANNFCQKKNMKMKAELKNNVQMNSDLTYFKMDSLMAFFSLFPKINH